MTYREKLQLHEENWLVTKADFPPGDSFSRSQSGSDKEKLMVGSEKSEK